MDAKYTVNPEWLKASHLVLFSGAAFPSFEEQIEADKKAQERMSRQLEQ